MPDHASEEESTWASKKLATLDIEKTRFPKSCYLMASEFSDNRDDDQDGDDGDDSDNYDDNGDDNCVRKQFPAVFRGQ